MLQSIKQNVLLPLATRLGSILAGILAPFGVHAEGAQMLAIGLIGVLLIGVDLVAAWLRKNKIVNDVLTGKPV